MRQETRWLDAGRHHAVRLAWDAAGGRALLEHDRGDRRSPLHDALRRHLALSVDGEAHRFDDNDSLAWSGPARTSCLRLGDLALWERALCHDAAEEGASIVRSYELSPLECRFLADNGLPHPATSDARDVRLSPRTDLHTHFAACLRGEDLVRLAVEQDVPYPRRALSELGIRSEGAEDDVRLADLPPPFLALFARRLVVPHDRQITFLEMERFYRLRSPLTKHPRLLVPQLAQLAADYARAGVRYAELSLSDVVRADVLRAIHRELPDIEARHGVTLRFLAAISRHDDLEWGLDVLDRLEEIAESAYLVGLDVMGHETNSTRAFERQLREAASRLSKERPGFVLRVHAGESPAHPANVRDALDLTRGHDVRLRVGHGLYGVDDATLEALAREGVLVEFNLTSNFSLNNVQSLADVPLVRYVRAGVPVVLGTDGPGLYGTDASFETRAARLAGLDEAGLACVLATEATYVEERLALDAAHARMDFEVGADLVHRHYGPAVLLRRRALRAERDARLETVLDELGVSLIEPDALDALCAGRRCISIAGSWKNTWAATPEGVRNGVLEELASLVGGLSDALLITGGTRFGVEHEVQRLARERGVDVIGAIVSESPPAGISPDVRWATRIADTLYAKAAALYELMRRHGGACIFVGGGPIVSDEIQTALNLRLDVLLMDGLPGSSSRHAREQPDRAFRTAKDALARLDAARARPAPFWYLGPNPTADVVIARRDGDRLRILAIRRDLDAPSEPGRWALPGGFVRTDANRGESWRAGAESALAAALRELDEEAGLDLGPHAAALVVVGAYEGGGRDPRDRADAWSRSTAFAAWLPDALRGAALAGGDDASDARWIDLGEVDELAFDHPRIVRDALARLGH